MPEPVSPEAPRTCGPCTLCCKVLGVQEFGKPPGVWCPHCQVGRGCGAYAGRPPSCRNFACRWLLDRAMPDSFRPDRCKVVLYATADETRLIAQCDPGHPMAWRREPIYGQLKQWAKIAWAERKTVSVLVGERLWLLTPRQELDLGVVDPEARLAIAERPDGAVDVRIAPVPAAASPVGPTR